MPCEKMPVPLFGRSEINLSVQPYLYLLFIYIYSSHKEKSG
jgi:hypothetical protein